MSKVVRPRSMKYSTPASCAPGVSSLGIMREVMASISLASSAPKNSNLVGTADRAAWRACVAAARRAGQCAETQTAESPPAPWARKLRRLKGASISSNLDYDSANVSGEKRSVKNFLAAFAESSEPKWFRTSSAGQRSARQTESCFLRRGQLYACRLAESKRHLRWVFETQFARPSPGGVRCRNLERSRPFRKMK